MLAVGARQVDLVRLLDRVVELHHGEPGAAARQEAMQREARRSLPGILAAERLSGERTYAPDEGFFERVRAAFH